MKKIIVFMFYMICLSCQNETDVDEPTDVEEPTEIEDPIENGGPCERGDPIAIEDLESTYLDGTKWKLVGIVNTETGYTEELEPRDCENCFTLTFDTDYTATVHCISRGTGKLDLRPTSFNRCPYVMFTSVLITEIYKKDGEYYDVSVFEELFFRIESFTVTNDELKLFYSTPVYEFDEKGNVIALIAIKDENCFTLFKRIEE